MFISLRPGKHITFLILVSVAAQLLIFLLAVPQHSKSHQTLLPSFKSIIITVTHTYPVKWTDILQVVTLASCLLILK